MFNITLDPITKKFTQVEPEKKTCYVCGSNNFVDDHHYDCREGTLSPETVPLCRRCHRTYHMYRGIHMFEDEYLDKVIEIENKRREIWGEPPFRREDIKRSDYWNKKHGIKQTKENVGTQTPTFPFKLPYGEPLCGWEWVNDHLYDLVDYVPRIEIIHDDLHLIMNIKSEKEMREVGKVLRGLKVRKQKVKEVITLDPVSKRFGKEVISD